MREAHLAAAPTVSVSVSVTAAAPTVPVPVTAGPHGRTEEEPGQEQGDTVEELQVMAAQDGGWGGHVIIMLVCIHPSHVQVCIIHVRTYID